MRNRCRGVALVALIACGDKRQAEPVVPSTGSAPPIVVATPDAGPPSRIKLRASGKPPAKSTRPVGREQLSRLVALDLGMPKTVRKLDDAFLDVAYRHEAPALAVIATVQPCLRCEPMQLARWQAEGDALRVTVPPDLRDRTDTTFEVVAVSLGGAPAIATRHWAATDHTVVVYFNDGVNQLRVIVSSEIEEPREELEQLALAVADRIVTTW